MKSAAAIMVFAQRGVRNRVAKTKAGKAKEKMSNWQV
jgi:hypothetical protein